MYRINEIFYSLQGEGYNTGTPCVFVRFSGCNLRCHFCDTDHEQGTPMSLPQIISEVNRWHDAPLLVLTGGEPSLWIDEQLVQALKQMTGKRIAIETNGTRMLPPGIDWVTLSPKGAYPGGATEPLVVTQCDELKVVYTGQDLLQYDHIDATHRFLQPCYDVDDTIRERNLKACVKAVLEHPQWRLSLQTHRVLGIR